MNRGEPMKLVSIRRFGALAGVALLAMAALGAAAPAAAQQQVFTAMVSSLISGGGIDPDYLVGTIPGSAGRPIRIIRVGLAGDATDQSGPHAFQAVGAGLDFTWGAGQVSQSPLVPLDYDLAPTVVQVGVSVLRARFHLLRGHQPDRRERPIRPDPLARHARLGRVVRVGHRLVVDRVRRLREPRPLPASGCSTSTWARRQRFRRKATPRSRSSRSSSRWPALLR